MNLTPTYTSTKYFSLHTEHFREGGRRIFPVLYTNITRFAFWGWLIDLRWMVVYGLAIPSKSDQYWHKDQ
jgi:hypothetical protein